MEYPDRLSLAQTPTPLQPLDKLRQKIGGPRIWLKRDDLTGSTLSGNKVRKLEFIAAMALEQGFDALITCGGIQSNHCRATALVAAQLGLDCHLILRGTPDSGEPAEGNQLLDEISGCTISYHPPREYFRSLDDIFATVAERYAAKGGKALAIPTGGSDGHGVWGYVSACDELVADFQQHAIQPELIVTASGSGGTQAGLTLGSVLHNLGADVLGIAVCDNEQYFVNKVRDDIEDWCDKYPQYARQHSIDIDDLTARIRVNDHYVGEGYGLAGQSVIDTVRLLARTEGVVFDPVYSGKAFDGLLQEIAAGRLGDHSDIVFIHTGGVFGLFSYKDQLSNLSR